MWLNLQDKFSESLVDPETMPPTDLHGFNVYRNNVAVSLKEALGDTFPVVKSLVGNEFFDAMAGIFWRKSPPTSPVLAEWGDGFADFIQSFDPAASLPFLADMARIEWAWLQSYHSEDAAPVSMEILSGLSEEALDENALTLHPSIGLVLSSSPVVSIWLAHQQQGHHIDLSDLPDQGENALVLRPEFDVLVHKIEKSELSFIQSCLEGHSITQSLEKISEENDPAHILINLFQRGCVIGFHPINS